MFLTEGRTMTRSRKHKVFRGGTTSTFLWCVEVLSRLVSLYFHQTRNYSQITIRGVIPHGRRKTGPLLPNVKNHRMYLNCERLKMV